MVISETNMHNIEIVAASYVLPKIQYVHFKHYDLLAFFITFYDNI